MTEKWLPSNPPDMETYLKERKKVLETRTPEPDPAVEEAWSQVKFWTVSRLLGLAMDPKKKGHEELQKVVESTFQDLGSVFDEFLENESPNMSDELRDKLLALFNSQTGHALMATHCGAALMVRAIELKLSLED